MQIQDFTEPPRSVPIVRDCDVLVCGGGPAGIAAAIAAARAGASVQLIELAGCLGGVWTAGLLSWIIDGRHKPGIMQEIIQRLKQCGACTADAEKVIDFTIEPVFRDHDLSRDFAYDAEEMKLLLEEMAVEAGVRVRLHTRVVAAAMDKSGRLTHAITESKSGREAWTARIFIDATGDGDLAALAGCGYDVGHPETGQVQPMSLMCLVAGVHASDVEPYISEWRAGVDPPKARLLDVFREAGVELSYAKPVLFRIHDDLFALCINHEYGASALDADQITQATIRARAEILHAVRALRQTGNAWTNLRVVATAEQIGIREARRIRGRQTVTGQDLVDGVSHRAAAAHVTFPVDVHALDPRQGKSYDNEGVVAQPYDIPIGALIARDVDGLLMAGRCISGDFIAHASYRVTGDAVAMGQTAGVVAALAARMGRLPHEVEWQEIEARLRAVDFS